MLAIMIQASALAIVVSKFLARRRLRPSQAKVRSTTKASRFGPKASDALGTGDDFNCPLAQIADRFEQLWSSIDAVSKDVAQFGEHPCDASPQRHSAMIVLNVGGVDENCKQRAFDVDDDVALTAFHFLGHVKATRTAAFRGFYALAVDDAGRWRRLAPDRLARHANQAAIDAVPCPSSRQR